MNTKRSIVCLLSFVLYFFSSSLSIAEIYRDSLGRDVSLANVPERIISLAPSITEIIYYLGLEDKLVGVSRFSSFPEEARKKPSVGSYTDINVEKVLVLNPNLIFATVDGNRREDVEILTENGVPVYVINPRTVEQLLGTIEVLGKICGVPRKAKMLVGDLRARVTEVTQAIGQKKRPLVFLAINEHPLISVNHNTIHHDIIRLAGGENLAADQPVSYPRLNIEEVIRRRPDVIIVSTMERGGQFEKIRREWMRWSSLPAVRNKNIYFIDSDLIDRPAPRIVGGLEEMARLIHPEIQLNERR